MINYVSYNNKVSTLNYYSNRMQPVRIVSFAIENKEKRNVDYIQ